MLLLWALRQQAAVFCLDLRLINRFPDLHARHFANEATKDILMHCRRKTEFLGLLSTVRFADQSLHVCSHFACWQSVKTAGRGLSVQFTTR